jgi:hypothetical protein
LLKATDATGRTDWASHAVVVTRSLQPAVTAADAAPGLHYRYFEGLWKSAPKFDDMTAVSSGIAPKLEDAVRLREDDYALVFDGYIAIPTDGGYTLTLVSRDGGELSIGGVTVASSPAPVGQVCGSVGDMVQAVRGSIGLKAGLHPIRIDITDTDGAGGFGLRWEGPGLPLADVPASALFH